MSYKINFEAYSNNFSLPQKIIDDNFDCLNPIHLKVILLIYKNSYKNFSVNLLSNLLKVGEDEITRSMEYWVEKGLLDRTTNIPIKHEVVNLPPISNPIKPSREHSFLLECVEGLLKRPITPAEHKSVIHILDFIRLPADVVLMAIEYCSSVDKENFRYIEKICANWADKGINTHELAEQYLSFLKQIKQDEAKIKKMFGIENRSLTDYESDLVKKWLNEYNFPLDVIKLAYEKTVAATNKVAFAYMNKILSNWYELGYRVITDILPSDTAKSGRSSSLDIDELDRFWDTVPKLR